MVGASKLSFIFVFLAGRKSFLLSIILTVLNIKKLVCNFFKYAVRYTFSVTLSLEGNMGGGLELSISAVPLDFSGLQHLSTSFQC